MKTPLAAHVGLPFNVTVLIASNTDRRWHDLHVGCRKGKHLVLQQAIAPFEPLTKAVSLC